MDNAGGLVGLNDNSQITDSYAAGLVTASSYWVGGLVGESFGDSARILRSYATGDVVATGATYHVAGLIGSNAAEIEDSYATGGVTGLISVGGFVGTNQDGGSISRCYSYGTVAADMNPGGFAGVCSGTIAGSYWDTDASAIEESAGGEGRTTSQMQAGTPDAYINPDGTVDGDQALNNLMYDGWDTSVWNFGADGHYPVLQ